MDAPAFDLKCQPDSDLVIDDDLLRHQEVGDKADRFCDVFDGIELQVRSSPVKVAPADIDDQDLVRGVQELEGFDVIIVGVVHRCDEDQAGIGHDACQFTDPAQPFLHVILM